MMPKFDLDTALTTTLWCVERVLKFFRGFFSSCLADFTIWEVDNMVRDMQKVRNAKKKKKKSGFTQSKYQRYRSKKRREPDHETENIDPQPENPSKRQKVSHESSYGNPNFFRKVQPVNFCQLPTKRSTS